MHYQYLDRNDWEIREAIGLDWESRKTYREDTRANFNWIPATVPGSVANDLWQAGLIADPYYGLNSKAIEWICDRTWVYRKKFTYEKHEMKRVRLIFKGLDYHAYIYLNDTLIGEHQSQYVPFIAEVTDLLREGENQLSVALLPSPIEQTQIGRSSLVHTHKTRMSYWWDFAPRMIHQGIWDRVYLDFDEGLDLDDVYLYSKLSDDLSQAEVHVELNTHRMYQGGKLLLEIDGQSAEMSFVDKLAHVSITIDKPQLWYPAGYGDQALYEAKISLFTKDGKLSDQKILIHGIRKVRWLDNPGAPSGLPAYTLEINNQPVYVKGVNWVPIDSLYGVVREEKLENLLDKTVASGAFLLRVWGGGTIEKNLFYDLCAQKGILVWQEFIQSSSGIDDKSPESAQMLKLMLIESDSIIKRKRNHTALLLWCGGNELKDELNDPEDEDNLMHQILGGQVRRLDPNRRFIPTSPFGGKADNSLHNNRKYPHNMADVHGPWSHQGFGKQYELYNKGTSLFSSEFGVEGFAFPETIERTIPESYRLPFVKENPYYFHRAQWWIHGPLVKECFGPIESLDKLSQASQYIQFEGLRYAMECQIRRAPRHSGSLPWQLNEPYPNACCTNLIDYYGEVKPGYYAMKTAYQKVYPTASFEDVRFKDCLEVHVHLHSEFDQAYNLRLNWYKEDGSLLDSLNFDAIRDGFVETVELTGEDQGLYLLRLDLYEGDKFITRDEYMFTSAQNYQGIFTNQTVSTVEKLDDGLELRNPGNKINWWNLLRAWDEDDKNIFIPTNYFCLLPQEKRLIIPDRPVSRVKLTHF